MAAVFLAEEFLLAPLPRGWTETFMPEVRAVFYINSNTGKSQWDHPMYGYYKEVRGYIIGHARNNMYVNLSHAWL